MWAVIATLVIAGGLFWFTMGTTTTETTPTNQTPTEQVEAQNTITVNEDGTVVTYEGIAGEIVLDTMKAGIAVRTDVNDFGEFVTGIGEVDADSSENFWGYTVNGEFAQVGAGEYVAEEGDQIEWQLTQLN